MTLTPEEAVALVEQFGKQTNAQLDIARTIADAVLRDYADFDEYEWLKYKDDGIWNDHASVQASLATIRLYMPLLEALDPVIEMIENTIVHEGVERLCLPIADLQALVNVYRGRTDTQS